MENNLLELLRRTQAYTKMNKAIDSKTPHISIMNMEEGVQAMYAIMGDSSFNNLILCENENTGSRIVKLINSISPDSALLLPEEPSHFYFADSHSREISYERISVLNQIISGSDKIIVAPFEVVIKKILPKEYYSSFNIHLKLDDIIPMDELINKLLNCGYERVEQVENKGQFVVKGGLVDVFSILEKNPIRIEFFDDEIDSIRYFDVDSQISIDKTDSITISPTREIIFNEEDRENIIKKLKKQLSNNKSSAKSNSANIENYIHGDNTRMEDLVGYYEGTVSSILDYFSEDMYVTLCDPDSFIEKYQVFMEQLQEDYNSLMEKGEVLKNFFHRFYTMEDILGKFKNFKTIQYKSFHKSKVFIPSQIIIDGETKETEKFYGRIPAFVDRLTQWNKEDYTIVIAAKDSQQSITILDMLTNYNIRAYNVGHDLVRQNKINIVLSSIEKSFTIISDRIVIFTANDIFNIKEREKNKHRKSDKGKKIESFTQLNIGDYIVHDVHGIGIYMGIEQITVEGVKKDYLHLKYAKGDKLFIPVDQMESVQVYIGFGEKRPKVNKLGSGDWKKAKQNTKASIKDMADELIKIYAQRRHIKGYAFSKDNQWIKEFEDKFPYEETGDQVRSISEVKNDMEQTTPMDRLLCGDVGYGKTEVAIRAAFKAVMDNKQVAILVPTTILAQQHYNNFLQRFEEYPIQISMLSRFRTKKQQDEIVKEVSKNRVDILIGTHRLISKDVKFKDLGLLIIDEEQRFGVKHKEKIKELKTNIDVLTLSATPIPRTLHMSLIGARDMSILNEPPHNRTPVQTYEIEYNDILVKDAINKELARGGQVYYVYNRVHNIESVLRKVSKMVPEAKIAIAHGQLSEVQLEKIMIDFLNHQYDILICTTIIESGLDIPNVNTIIIEDADQMGLSQLYQLRGRVGRSDRLAYAYITYRKDKVLTEIAHKRLKAIKDFTEFGSGFKIAMRDLEIRGAGNLLGSRQHGHLASVGYDMYCKLLDEAVKELKGEMKPEETNTILELEVNGFIPSHYIESEKQKYELYKKILNIDSQEELYAIEEEIEDRFGDLPQSVINLLYISYIKRMSVLLNIQKIENKGSTIFITIGNKVMFSAESIKEIIKIYPIQFNSDGVENTILEIKLQTKGDSLLKEIKEVLEKIISTKNQTT